MDKNGRKKEILASKKVGKRLEKGGKWRQKMGVINDGQKGGQS